MRDIQKNTTYFTSFILKNEARVKKFEDAIRDGGLPDDRIKSLKRQIFYSKLHIFIASYSRGDELSQMRSIFFEIIDFMQKGWDAQGGYVSLLWMLSVGVMLDIDQECLDAIINIKEENKISDGLLDSIIAFKRQNYPVSEKVIFPRPYQKIFQLINEDDNSNSLAQLINYVEKEWYKGHSDSYWFNSHKSQNNTYFGYWSFESGVVAKILNLNDTKLKNVVYYPYDMVHFGY
jgi:hypothetical protein